MKNISDAIHLISPGSRVIVREESLDLITWITGKPNGITKEQIREKLAELQAAEPLRLLRIERDRLLAECDWWASSDLTMSAKRKSYRQALRDLPASASPSLDESGQLKGVTWPTKPV